MSLERAALLRAVAAACLLTSLLTFLLTSTGPFAWAQTAPAFDVVSLRPFTASGGGRAGPPGGSLRFSEGKVQGRASAKKMVQEAYGVTQYQVSGGPGWFNDDLFEIEAKASGPADEPQLRAMLRTMLADRFNLVLRHETSQMPIYSMTIARPGFLFKADASPSGFVTQKGLADMGYVVRHHAEGPSVRALVNRGTLAMFASLLSGGLEGDRPVVDRTGDPGDYLFVLQWGADENVLDAAADQFGLKFQAERAPVDTIVIESIARPSAN